MWTVHQRLAELWHKHSNDSELSEDEIEEFKLCLDANTNKAWKLAELENLSLIASMIDDTDWLHDICAEIEKVLQ